MLPAIDKFVNIHAHRLAKSEDEWVLTNIMAQDYPPDEGTQGQYSVGLHPWYLEGSDISGLLKRVQLSTEDTRVFAIGETGLDKVIKTPMELQIKVFEAQVDLAEQHDLAVVIHAVKTFNELKEFVKTHKPVAPMIIHGFRGSTQIGMELLELGFHISFGAAVRGSDKLDELIREIPMRRIFLESDEDDVHIPELYKAIATLKEVPVELLKMRVAESALRVFNRQIEY